MGWNIQLLHMLTLTRSEVQQFSQAAVELQQLGRDVKPLNHTYVLITGKDAAAGELPHLCMIASCTHAAGEPLDAERYSTCSTLMLPFHSTAAAVGWQHC